MIIKSYEYLLLMVGCLLLTAPLEVLGVIPVEDFLFGWAMVTAVLLLWVHNGRKQDKETV